MQWVKCSLCRYEDPNLSPEPRFKIGKKKHKCGGAYLESCIAQGRGRQVGPRDSLASLACLGSSKQVRDPVSVNKVDSACS